MEEKRSRGGKRIGAGRKPIDNPKKQFTFYFKKGLAYKFGGEEKMKEKVYEFVEKYGEQAEQPKVYDAPKINNSFRDEPKQWQEPVVDPLQVWKNQMNQCDSLEELDYVGQSIAASGLTRLDQNILTKYGKMVCDNKGFL